MTGAAGGQAMLLAVRYLLAASFCTTAIQHGGYGWLSSLVLLLYWDALKFLVFGPVSLVLLVRARVRELREQRTNRLVPDPVSHPPASRP